MSLRPAFTAPHIAEYSIGLVSTNGCTDEFRVGSKTISLENYEVAIIHSLMTAKSGINKFQIMAQTSIPTTSLFEQVMGRLMDKLSEIDIANYGGNGSYYNQTIWARDLFKIEDGCYSFNSPLANLIGKTPILSDAQLNSIEFQPQAPTPDYGSLSR